MRAGSVGEAGKGIDKRMFSATPAAVMRITPSKDCGNSPKNLRAQDLAIALASAKPSQLETFLAPDVVWERPASPPAEGAPAVLEAVATLSKVTSIAIEHAITHGKVGALSGTIKLRGGSPQGFCHVVEFADAKASRVRSIKTYALDALFRTISET